MTEAFGGPGIPPTLAPADKDVVTRALGSARLWATIGGGIVNEVYWPTTSRPQLRDLGFLVTGDGFWVEVKRTANYTVELPGPAVPAPTITHIDDRFTLVLDITCDPDRDTLLVQFTLTPTTGYENANLQVHVLAAPRLGGSGHDNRAWTIGSSLYATHFDEHLCLVADPPFSQTSVGFVGASDLWQDLERNGRQTWSFTTATGGNVAISGTAAGPTGTIAVAFADSPQGAHTLAASSLAKGHTSIDRAFEAGWTDWVRHAPAIVVGHELAAMAATSAMVLRVHEDTTFPGAIIASLSTPWGAAHDDPGGYHLVWPRDCAQTALALAAVGFLDDALRTAQYLAATQSDDGHWAQNFTPGGEPYWTGRQLDETALPVILACKLAERGVALEEHPALVRMVRKAVAYLAANGPATEQDRWEEAAGLSPFTVAATIAAIAGAALGGWLTPEDADYALSLADWWNDRLESMVYVEDSDLDRRYGTAGHYERIAAAGPGGTTGQFMLANRGGELADRSAIVGLEFLTLVRYGLRHADDPRIVDTVTIIDGELRVELPTGAFYYRYQRDGYGEHADGRAFDGAGIGRPWPLLAGERGFYALERGESVLPYLRAMAASASAGGLIPEQVWDAADIPAKRLTAGRPSGSAMPLVWAHAEFLKLLAASLGTDRPDRLSLVAARYATVTPATVAHIRDEADYATNASTIVIERDHPFLLHYGIDGWAEVADRHSKPLGLGRHGVSFSRADLRATFLLWTTYDPATNRWDGIDHRITLRRLHSLS